MKNFYLVLAVAGAILPALAFLGLFGGEPLPSMALWLQALYVNVGTAAAFTDLAWSSLVFWIFVFSESARLQLRHAWAYIPLNAFVGLSCALPLFLYFRARRLQDER